MGGIVGVMRMMIECGLDEFSLMYGETYVATRDCSTEEMCGPLAIALSLLFCSSLNLEARVLA